MKIIKFLLGVCVMGYGLIASQTQAAFDSMNTPGLTSSVTDFAGVLSSGQIQGLSLISTQYEQETSHQLVAVLIPDRGGFELFDIALKIFNSNKLGQKGVNNGLLLVISTTDKKIRIMVGGELQDRMTDVTSKKVIESYIRPLVNSGDFAGAVNAYLSQSISIIGTGGSTSLAVANDFDVRHRFTFICGGLFGFLVLYKIIESYTSKSKRRISSRTYVIGLVICFGVLLVATGMLFFVGGMIGGYIVRHIMQQSGIDTGDLADIATGVIISGIGSDSSSSSSFSGGGGSSDGGGAGD